MANLKLDIPNTKLASTEIILGSGRGYMTMASVNSDGGVMIYSLSHFIGNHDVYLPPAQMKLLYDWLTELYRRSEQDKQSEQDDSGEQSSTAGV